MVDVAKFFMDFIQRESCGKCIPVPRGHAPHARDPAGDHPRSRRSEQRHRRPAALPGR
ncbi:MAG: NADH-ubiquinone oxidoreductase-F iron-sulfur binding region domain-containing protein [Thermoanaerobaculaceae bacterium]